MQASSCHCEALLTLSVSVSAPPECDGAAALQHLYQPFVNVGVVFYVHGSSVFSASKEAVVSFL